MLEKANEVENNGWITGVELMQRRKNILKISTGSEQLDKMLAGGIES